MSNHPVIGCYGFPPHTLYDASHAVQQCSPLAVGATILEQQPKQHFDAITMLAPTGTIERRYAIALGLRALKSGGLMRVMGHKKKGGTRIKKELEMMGCSVQEDSQQHYRICDVTAPETITDYEAIIAAGAQQYIDAISLWSQPGVFSWDRLDAGSLTLLDILPALTGHGADLGCGIGVLSQHILRSEAVSGLELIDTDWRAIEAAKRNIDDPRARFHWEDARATQMSGLDFMVTNPPFHDAGMEDKTLGQTFLSIAADMLKPKGICWIVANRHLPYENLLSAVFSQVYIRNETNAYKIIEAIK